MALSNFLKKLVFFDVIFSSRSKKLTGVNDFKNTTTESVIISSVDNSISFVSGQVPDFMYKDQYFRVLTGTNENELFRIKEINQDKIITYENLLNDTGNITLDARLWVVHGDNSISRKSPTNGTMFNVDNMDDTGTDCDGSKIAKAYTSHYHNPDPRKVNVVPEGQKNNENVIFNLPNGEKFVEGTLEIYLSHLHLDSDQFTPNVDRTGFTIILEPEDKWKLNCPPLQGESLTINYLQDVE